MQNTTVNKLKNLGFSEKEIAVYFIILRRQQVRVSQIAKATSIKRSSIYYSLDKLIEKGFITQIIQEDKKYYIPEDVKKVFEQLLIEQKTTVKDILPDLKDMIGDNLIQPKIKIYKHKIGMKRLLDNILKCEEKVIRYYISDFNVEKLVGENFVESLVRKRIELGIEAMSLRSFEYNPKRYKNKLHSEQLRKTKFLPEKTKIKPYIAIFDNKVIIISSVKEKVGFIVESKDFADAQKVIFDLLWVNY